MHLLVILHLPLPLPVDHGLPNETNFEALLLLPFIVALGSVVVVSHVLPQLLLLLAHLNLSGIHLKQALLLRQLRILVQQNELELLFLDDRSVQIDSLHKLLLSLLNLPVRVESLLASVQHPKHHVLLSLLDLKPLLGRVGRLIVISSCHFLLDVLNLLDLLHLSLPMVVVVGTLL